MKTIFSVCCTWFVFVLNPVMAQGPLSPPGPPVAMMKTLDQVEARTPITSLPQTIKSRGSYYITTNLTGGSDNGIEIATSDVVLDLNGFTLRGGTGNAIMVTSLCSNIWIRNGAIVGWGLTGISNRLANASGVENVNVMNCGRDGILLGDSAVVRACMVISCADRGIDVEDDSLVEGCTVSSNAASQIIETGDSSQVINCISTHNIGDGINTGDGNRVIGCVSSGNTRGIFLGNNCLVEKCVVEGNSSIGIRTFNVNVVRDCLVRGNGGDGIFAVTHNLLINNVCHFNGTNTGGAGIHMLGGTGTRIEGNMVNGNSWGIRVGSTNNIIIRNTAFNNDTNYFITNFNRVGFVVTAPNSGAISGNTGGAGVGTTDPWANIAY
jgi:parallel beta-helix repeat protein